jgi:hypothetical protein
MHPFDITACLKTIGQRNVGLLTFVHLFLARHLQKWARVIQYLTATCAATKARKVGWGRLGSTWINNS